MKKPKGKEKSRIERLIDKRDIKYLTHFTRIENLPSILQKGLMPRKQLLLQGIRPEVNDWNRLDNTDAVCLSVSFPNYKLFYRFRVKRPETKWAVILLDPIILDRCSCSFACRNAASNEMKLDSYETTDPQAEVLVHEVIEPRYIKKIIVQESEQLTPIRDLLPNSALQKITTENKLRYYSKQRQEYRSFFDKRSDFLYW